jgi:hypothetical protein
LSKEGKNKTITNATCKWCGTSLSPTHLGPCPKCGKVGKNVVATAEDSFTLVAYAKWIKIREFYKVNTKIKWIVIIITIVSLFTGFVFEGILGIFISIAINIILYILGPYVTIKIREVERG